LSLWIKSSDRVQEIPNTQIDTLVEFTPVSQDELEKVISKSKSKSCELDSIPTWLLKECLKNCYHLLSFWTFSNAVSVEWTFLYADWGSSWRLFKDKWLSKRASTTFSSILDTYGFKVTKNLLGRNEEAVLPTSKRTSTKFQRFLHW
jgi:hypothetical protein